jgi:hypothetical protein
MLRRSTYGLITAAGLFFVACASDHITAVKPGAGQGLMAVRLTDAPTPLDSIKEVNIFIEKIEARRARADSGEADEDLDGNHDAEQHMAPADSTLWVTIATPNKAFNLLNLQNGVTALLGTTPIDTGHFAAVRLIIDPAQSNVVLKDGTILTTTSKPPVDFENSHRHGLLVELQDSLEVNESHTTTVTLDLLLNQSLTLRGQSVRDGFFFRPMVNGRSHRDD